MQRAGYSTADPSLSGFTTASLTSPTLTAPQQVAPMVESEFTPQMADTLIKAKSSSLANTAQMFQTIADISLKRAQTEKTKAETTGLVKNNAWIDLEKNALFAQTLEQTELLHQQGKVSQKTADKLANDLSMFSTQMDMLNTQLELAKKQLGSFDVEFLNRMAEVTARIDNVNADTANKNKQGELLSIQKEFDSIVRDYAKMGINFNSSNLFHAIGALLTSNAPADLVDSVSNTIREVISSVFTNVVDGVTDAVTNVPGAIVSGAKKVGKAIIDKFNGK